MDKKQGFKDKNYDKSYAKILIDVCTGAVASSIIGKIFYHFYIQEPYLGSFVGASMGIMIVYLRYSGHDKHKD